MNNDVQRDLSNSASDFLRVVVPAIRPLIGDGRIEPVEGVAGESLKRDLDVLAGIDAFQMQDDHGRMRAIASRVQWGKNWRTFSIRRSRANGYETEWHKRVTAFMQPSAGWLLPALTVQAYLTECWLATEEPSLIQAAVIRTTDLYEFALKNPCQKPRENHQDCNHNQDINRCALFDWYSWDALLDAGVRVGIVPPSAPLSRQD